MPYQTFFNLPDAKRQRLMDAVWQEFTTVSYADASINRIIQAAEISRGSFYQYFSGKQDLFSYILTTALQTGKEMFAAQLTVHNNDLFAAVLGMYDTILWCKNRGRRSDSQRRIYTLLKLNYEMDMTQFTEYLDQQALTQHIEAMMQQSGYRLNSTQESYALLNMLASIGLSNLAETMHHPQHEERNRQLLEQQLLIIRRGLSPYRQE